MEVLFELEALALAKNYQQWMLSAVEPFLGESILELGAGIGNLSQWLPQRKRLVLSELEDAYLERLRANPRLQGPKVSAIKIDLDQPLARQLGEFELDTIVSFNVMEHIEDDAGSIRAQVDALRASTAAGPKTIVIFVPALQIAYGELDRVFKHHRRYSAGDLRRIFKSIDPRIEVTTFYFNLLSLIPWIIKGRILKDTRILPEDVAKVEKVIPLWKPLDYLLTRVFRLPFAQSVVCVARI